MELEETITKLETVLGSAVSIDQIDHVAEHSIELQLPWLQYCFGNVPVVAALIPSPLIDMIEDDDEPWMSHPMYWAPFMVVGEGAIH